MQTYKVTVDTSGTIRWYNSAGQCHRIDGPAIEGPCGYKAWWQDGKRHRTDGPACEWANGDKEWYVDGKLHRLDGPAYEGADGFKSWWIDGKRVTEEEHAALANPKPDCSGQVVTVDGVEYELKRKQ